MRVLVPFVPGQLRPETTAALDEHAAAHEVEYHDVSGDDQDYFRLLAWAWGTGETFCVIEHDVVVHESFFPEFDACPCEYGAFPYPWTVATGPALGATRFRTELLVSVPDALERVGEIQTAWGKPGHWKQLDIALLAWVLRDQEGLQPCVHLPPVAHLSERQRLLPEFANDPVLTEVIAETPAAWQLNARRYGVELPVA